jgi:hypothetical protein
MAVHFLDQLSASVKMINRLEMFAKLCSDRILMTWARKSEDGGGDVKRNDSFANKEKESQSSAVSSKKEITLWDLALTVHKILYS